MGYIMLKMISSISITTVPNFFENFKKCLFGKKMLFGDKIEDFENTFAKYIDTKHAIAVSSARYGMQLILKSLNLKKGTEIIMTSYTLDGLIPLIEEIGLVPKFVDIKPENFNMNADKIQEQITKRTKIIIVTHIFGIPCDMKKIINISKKHNLLILEDCAHAIGAKYFGKKVGTFGKASFFSFGSTKLINTFGGGMITTDDDDLAKKIRKHVIKNRFSRINLFSKILLNYFGRFVLNSFLNVFALRLLSTNFIYKHAQKLFIGGHGLKGNINFRYTNMQAGIGKAQLLLINKTIKERMNKANLYKKLLRKVSGIHLPEIEKGKIANYQDFVIRIDNGAEGIFRFLMKKNIYAAIGNDIMQNCTGSQIGRYPVTKKIIETTIKLPLNEKIGEKEIHHVVNGLKEYMKMGG